MQFTSVTLFILSIIIINTISDIRTLLDLQNHNSFSYRMNGATWNVNEISSLDFLFLKYIIPFPLVHKLIQLIFCFCMMSKNNFSVRFRLQYIPTFCFTIRDSLYFTGIRIIWMNLYR